MKYLTIEEFAKMVFIAPITLYKKRCCPANDGWQKGASRPKQTWSQTTCNDYKSSLIRQLEHYLSDGLSVGAAARASSMGESQAAQLLSGRPKESERVSDLENGFKLFINISSSIRSQLNGE